MKPVLMVTLASAVVVSMIIARPFMSASPARAASASTAPLTIEQLIDIRHPSNPTWSPDGRSVVFVWDRAGVSKVYVATASSPAGAAQAVAAPRELPEAGASLNGAFWSGDGKALMLPKNGDLWRVPIDGTAASAVWTTPQPESNIVASPDGARVAFVRPQSGAAGDTAARPTASVPAGRG